MEITRWALYSELRSLLIIPKAHFRAARAHFGWCF